LPDFQLLNSIGWKQMNKPQIFNYPLFALGFRAFFLLAGFAALALIALWKSIHDGSLTAANYYPAVYWHAHEMLLGYAAAVIAGFLLTAVKNWTGQQTVQWDKLAGLCFVWLYGRLLPFYAGIFPDSLIALVDLSFLPLLAYCIAKPIIATKNFKNLIFPALLLIITFGNSLIHLELLGIKPSAWTGFSLIIATIIMLILVIAGRVFPFFTERGLTNVLIIPNPLFEMLSMASAGLVFLLQLLHISGTVLALTAVFAAIANSARMLNWYNRRIWYVPLLWILYTGYGWIILGFGLTALNAYGWIGAALSLHAFTVGGIGILTLGMMARVALGHTGRALRVSNAMALAFVLLNLAALFRVLMPTAIAAWYEQLVYISTLSWLAAFSLFLVVYTPILTAARIDGKEG
jgi:uncharacterized protein involved in response to NO